MRLTTTLIAIGLILFSCRKDNPIPERIPVEENNLPKLCDDNNLIFQKATQFFKGKPPTNPHKPPKDTIINPPPPIDTTTAGDSSVILLDFDGHTVTGTVWNSATNNEVIYCQPSGLTPTQTQEVIDRVKYHYSQFTVKVTTSEDVYNSTTKHQRVIITTSYEWYGQAGGVAIVGTMGQETPCFVFSSLLGYNSHHTGEASAHEAGHTLGCYHQSDCSGTTVTNQYSNGKIMGVSYYVEYGVWWVGTSSRSCQIQDDVQVIKSHL